MPKTEGRKNHPVLLARMTICAHEPIASNPDDELSRCGPCLPLYHRAPPGAYPKRCNASTHANVRFVGTAVGETATGSKRASGPKWRACHCSSRQPRWSEWATGP